MKKKGFTNGFTYKITILYLIFGMLWILLSDKILEFLISDPALLTDIQTYKGTFYVILTALLLYLIILDRSKKQRITDKRLQKTAAEYKKLVEEFQVQNVALKVAVEKSFTNERFMRGIIDNIPDLVFVKDSQDGKYLFINKSVEIFIGKSHESMQDKDDYSLFPKEIADIIVANDQKVIQDGVPTFYEELSPSINGDRLLFSTKIPIRDSEGNIRYLLGVSQDITKKREEEKDLIVAKEKAEESDRLKTAFLQNISHEIRTPMNAIYGFSEMLADPSLNAALKTNYASLIQSNCDRLLKIITDVLTMSSIEKDGIHVHNNTIYPQRLVENIVQQFQPLTANKGLYLTSNLEWENNLQVQTDGYKIREIISNILSNALKYTNTGGINISGKMEDSTLIFSVKDTGMGLEEHQKESIFDHFKQVSEADKNNLGGIGLGLAICKSYATILGGSIKVESQPGVGSEFIIHIPCILVAPNLVNTEPQPSKNTKITTPTILVAEDDDTNFLLIDVLLKPQNWKLLRASNGAEAVQLVKDDSSIDLILMDIRMPIMRGDEAAIQIKKIRPDLPILAQTAYALDSEVERYKKVFDGYLTKPLHGQALIQKIQHHLAL